MKLIHAFILAASLALVGVPLAFAWPDQPPDSATISGPGINGTVAITDTALLKSLSLGGVEDFSAAVSEPASSVRYTIHRQFYNDTFDFGTLTYVAANGGYVRFEDGPAIVGSQTPFNGHWYKVTPAGQQMLTAELARLVPAISDASSPIVPVDSSANVWVWITVTVGVLGVGGWLARRRALAL